MKCKDFFSITFPLSKRRGAVHLGAIKLVNNKMTCAWSYLYRQREYSKQCGLPSLLDRTSWRAPAYPAIGNHLLISVMRVAYRGSLQGLFYIDPAALRFLEIE